MKTIYIFLATIVVCSFSAIAGNIWLTINNCANTSYSVSSYSYGNTVMLNGANFSVGDYNLTFKGIGLSKLCNLQNISSINVHENNNFCLNISQLTKNACGFYNVSVENINGSTQISTYLIQMFKRHHGSGHSSYSRSNLSAPEDGNSVPEFPMFGVVLAVTGGICGYAVLRK